MSKEITTDEIIQGLREGEKTYRGFKHGLEVAQAFKALETRKQELEKSIGLLEKREILTSDNLKSLSENLTACEVEAKKIVADAKEKASVLVGEAMAKITAEEASSESKLDAAEAYLSSVKEQTAEAEVARDNLKAELKALEEEKAKIRERILGAAA